MAEAMLVLKLQAVCAMLVKPAFVKAHALCVGETSREVKLPGCRVTKQGLLPPEYV